jgi:hypothetical protein
VKVSLE